MVSSKTPKTPEQLAHAIEAVVAAYLDEARQTAQAAVEKARDKAAAPSKQLQRQNLAFEEKAWSERRGTDDPPRSSRRSWKSCMRRSAPMLRSRYRYSHARLACPPKACGAPCLGFETRAASDA